MADLAPSQYAALKTELVTDPKGLGLPGMGLQAAANKLNEVGGSAEALPDRKVLEAWEVMGAIDTTEWTAVFSAMSAAQKTWFDDLVASGRVDISSARVRTGLTNIFQQPTAPNTRAAIVALVSRSASRAEVVFGAGIVVTYYDVDRARALP